MKPIDSKPETKEDTYKTDRELNESILKKTLKIREHYPELYVFLDEMQMNLNSNFEDGQVQGSNLQVYHDSLEALISNYERANRKQ